MPTMPDREVAETKQLPSPSTERQSTSDTMHVETRDAQSRNVPPNFWWSYKRHLKELVAEFTGTAILVLFGTGSIAQVILSSNPSVASTPQGQYLSIGFGFAAGISLGVWVSGGMSGGHINPAITLCFAVWRGFPWRKVPGYILAQLFGGIVGAALVYATYFHAIDIYEGGRGMRTLSTAGIFATYPLDYMTNVSCFFQEFLGTALLAIVVFAGTDHGNLAPVGNMLPLILFIVLLAEAICFGLQTGFALNPARDLGPRLLTSMVGYGRAVYDFRNQYWVWCPVIATILGAQAGAAFYDAFFYMGPESIVNKPDKTARRKMQEMTMV